MRYPLITDRNVLVTGCSSGIGWATAVHLRERGWNAIPTARKDADLAKLIAAGFQPLRLDVADAESVRAAAEEALRRFDQRPGALVNNAGYGQPGAIEDLSREAMRRQFEVNVVGLQDLTNRFLPVFRRLGRGRIVNVSSVLGRISLPFMGIYSASKFALEAVSDALRVELSASGIAVSIVEPGPIRTAFTDNAAAAGLSNLESERSVYGEDYRRQLRRREENRDREHALSAPPEAVAAKIHHALVSRRPRLRYPVTALAHFGALAARLLPAAAIDALMKSRWKAQRNE